MVKNVMESVVRVAIVGNQVSSLLLFRSDLIKMLVQSGIQVYAFANDYTEETRMQVLSLGAKPIGYKLSRAGLNPISDLWGTIQLSKKFKQLSLDVVFSYFSKPVIFATIAAKLAGIKEIYAMLEGLGSSFIDVPGYLSTKLKIVKYIQLFLYRVAFRFLDCIVFLNLDDQEELLGKHGIRVKKSLMLGAIGLDLSRYAYEPVRLTKNLTFIFIARMLEEKGVREFVDAAKLIKQKEVSARFLMIGSPDNENPGGLSKTELAALVKDGIVEYPGFVENVEEMIAASHVLVLPTFYREGVPRSIQEAMAVGRPVITTDAPGCKDVLIPGHNGLLVKKRDVPSLVSAICYFIDNSSEVERMGANAHEFAVANFDANEKCQVLMNLLVGEKYHEL